ncbi:hypothetical protein PWG14_23000 [Chromobacterium amazonense]|uniref:hypothetical protein n=1 Tax=Chromobacterium amazonense TaxID=1382803 RepID=UPI00237DA05F|nr:hypothetical protein [Chromobacterium amazonense]MDE1715334.1 hypothetical protein [Chromobacterium amazonense]
MEDLDLTAATRTGLILAQMLGKQATRSGAPLIQYLNGFDDKAAQRLQAALARVVFNEELVSGVRRPLRHSLGEALPC